MSREEVVPISSGSEDEEEDRAIQPPKPEEEDIIKDLVKLKTICKFKTVLNNLSLHTIIFSV